MSCLVKIRARLPELSTNEARIAEYVLAQPDEIRELSSKQLADRIGGSQSSVVKFAQKLGYSGYPDFKFAVNDAVRDQSEGVPLVGEICLDDGPEHVATKLLQNRLSVLTQTQGLNKASSLHQAVEMLNRARRVLLFGVGGSALVAKDLASKLQKLGIIAQCEIDTHVQLASLAVADKRDLLLAISASGSTSEVVHAVGLARERALPVISLTRFGDTPVSRKADLPLYMVTDPAADRLSDIVARTSQEYVVDLLFILLSQMSEKGRLLMAESNSALEAYKAAKG